MAVTLILDPYTALLVEAGIMGFIGFIIFILYKALKSRYGVKGGDSTEMYLGGEHPSIMTRPNAPATGFYWGFIRVFAKKLYYYVRDIVHSGKFNEWAAYMAGWFGFLMVLSLLVIYVVIGGLMI